VAIAVLVAQQSSVPSADFGAHAAGQAPIAVVARPPLLLLLDPAPLLLLLDPAPLLLLLDPAPLLLLDPAPPELLLLPPDGGGGALVELHPPVVATATAVPSATPMDVKKTTRPTFFIGKPYPLRTRPACLSELAFSYVDSPVSFASRPSYFPARDHARYKNDVRSSRPARASSGPRAGVQP
jgi:hypothetical protein